ncbi:HK97 family phage prohead protease [Mesorhizobium sp. SB112]|uniref:HK97 family phage prohead protease n=1 Tax=Mesorhizobium sp. SB112 TaxID=3151853 RepID=UPI003267BA98
MTLLAHEVREAAHNDKLDMTEVRFAATDDDGTIEGYAVRFNTVDSYKTSFDRNAFAWEGRSLPLLWSHNPGDVVGSVRSIVVEDAGLKIRGRLNLDVQRAREVRSMLQAGDIAGLSIGFQRLKDEARSGGVRHITKAELREVSFVAMPSVPGSQVTSIRTFTETGRDKSAAAFVASCRRAALALKGN